MWSFWRIHQELFASRSLCWRISFIFAKVNVKNKFTTGKNMKNAEEKHKTIKKNMYITKYRELEVPFTKIKFWKMCTQNCIKNKLTVKLRVSIRQIYALNEDKIHILIFLVVWTLGRTQNRKTRWKSFKTEKMIQFTSRM